MSEKTLKVKNFCIKGFSRDRELEDEFIKEDGFKTLLAIINTINEYANQLNQVVNTINILEEWKCEKFYTNKTTYKIDWFGCYKYDENIEKVTLNQAKKLYKEIKNKYDALYDMFKEVAEIHYKNNESELMDKYFSYKEM